MKLALASLALVAASVASADTIIVDSFTAGSSFTLTNTSGTASSNFISGESSILGGSRQVRVRAAGSGFYGPSSIAVNTTAGTLTSFGTDGNERFVQYGSAIGAITFTGAGPGTPVNLNLNLNLADSFAFDVSSVGSATAIQVTLYTNGVSATYSKDIPVSSAGTYTVSLSQFSGLTELAADDVDGILFNFPIVASTSGVGLTVSEARIETAAVPEPSSFAALAGAAALGFVAIRRRRA